MTTSEKTPNIYRTKKYDIFKFVDNNRDMNSHIVLDSIKKKDMLSSHPIIVNESMQVIDGQNRLKAAQELGCYIYYIIAENVSVEDIPDCQVNSQWQLSDYLKFHKKMNHDYRIIAELHEVYHISVPMLVLFASNMNWKAVKKFKNGSFKIENVDRLIKIMPIFHEVYTACRTTCKSSTGIYKAGLSVIYSLCSKPDYNHDRMMRKIERYPQKVIQTFKMKDAVNIKIELYRLYDMGSHDKTQIVL